MGRYALDQIRLRDCDVSAHTDRWTPPGRREHTLVQWGGAMGRWAAIVGLAALLVLGGCREDFHVHYRHAGQIYVTRGTFRTVLDGWHIGAAEIDCMVTEMVDIRSLADLTLARRA